MALGIFDVAKAPPSRLSGGRICKPVEFTLDAAYAAGGYAVTPAQLGLASIDLILPCPTSGYVPEWDYTNAKLKVMYGDNNNASDGPLIEVPNATAGISGLLSRALVIGVPA